MMRSSRLLQLQLQVMAMASVGEQVRPEGEVAFVTLHLCRQQQTAVRVREGQATHPPSEERHDPHADHVDDEKSAPGWDVRQTGLRAAKPTSADSRSGLPMPIDGTPATAVRDDDMWWLWNRAEAQNEPGQHIGSQGHRGPHCPLELFGDDMKGLCVIHAAYLAVERGRTLSRSLNWKLLVA